MARVEVTPTSATLEPDGQVQLSARAADANGFNVETTFGWSSSDESVATVSASGLVTAGAPGSTTVSATAQGKTGSAAITVQNTSPPTSPSALSARVASDEAVDLLWSDDSDVEDEFQIQRQEVGEDQDFEDLATVARQHHRLPEPPARSGDHLPV